MTRSFTNADKLAALERELKYRRRVYPRLIAEGKMSEDFASIQIAVFETLVADYTWRAQSERLI